MSLLVKPPDPLVESRIVLPNVSWQHYETLIAMFGDPRKRDRQVNRPHLRLTYLDGNLEIMSQLATYVQPEAEPQALKAFRQWMRDSQVD